MGGSFEELPPSLLAGKLPPPTLLAGYKACEMELETVQSVLKLAFRLCGDWESGFGTSDPDVCTVRTSHDV